MSNSTKIIDYLGVGTHAARPASPSIGTGIASFYYETDTGNTFVWDGAAWDLVVATGAGGVASLNGLAGALAVADASHGSIAVSASGSTVSLKVEIDNGTSEPGSPVLGQLFFRTDTLTLEIYDGSAWVPVTPASASGVSSLNTLTGALAIAAVSNGAVNVGTSGSNVNLKIAIPSGTSEPGSPYSGQLFYRTDTTTLEIYNGSAWVAVLAAGAGGVASLNALTGALSIAATSNGAITVAASGSNVSLKVTIPSGTSEPGSPYAGQLFYRTDTTTLEIYNGSAWVPVVSTGAGGVASLNGLAGTLAIADASHGSIGVSASGTTVSVKVAVDNGTSEPGSPYTGQLFFRTDTNTLELWNGSAWVPATPASSPAIALTSGAGVPSSSGSYGDIFRSTDGSPGMTLWTYVKSVSNLPSIINWGVAAATATGNVTVTMQRALTNGSTLVAFGGWQVGTIAQTLATGWTSIYSNSSPTPAVSAAWKANTSTSTTVTITNVTGSTPALFFVVEIATANATPIAGSASGGSNTALASQALGNLALLFGGNGSGMAGSDFVPFYEGGAWKVINGALGGSGFVLQAVPLVAPVIGSLQSTIDLYGLGMTANGIVCIAAGSGTTQLWTPYA